MGALIGGGLLYTVVSSAGGFADAMAMLATAGPGWVAAAVACEAGSFVLFGVLLRRLIGADSALSRRTAVDVGLVLTGLGNVLPAAPAEGLTMASAALRRRGIASRRAALALAFSEWYTTASSVALVAVSAIVVAAIVQLQVGNRLVRLWVFGLPALALLALLLLVARLAARRSTAQWAAVVAGRLRFWEPRRALEELRADGDRWWADAQEVLGDRTNRRAVLLLSLASITGDFLSLAFALWAVDVHPRAGGVVIAYGAVLLVSLVPLLPAGLGAVESVVPALLHHGHIPLAAGLAGVLVYRATSTVLPAAGGAVSLVRLRLSRPAPTPRPAADRGP